MCNTNYHVSMWIAWYFSWGMCHCSAILIPVVAAAGLKPATVACLFQSSGETGLIWGPFTGPTVALLAITGLSYGRMMLWQHCLMA